jgi:hypothetical protein|tara:strand:- start:473 stop:913 length:441 start_codon:yes stop_codon:yes gene_type:complete
MSVGSAVFGVFLFAVGVGSNDPQSLSEMGRSQFGCRKHSPSCIEPAFGQVPVYRSCVFVSKESWHVLQQCEFGSNDAKGIDCCWPHVPLVCLAEPFAGGAEWLAGESCGNDINHSLILGSDSLVKLSDVHIPDGEFIQVPFGLPLR